MRRTVLSYFAERQKPGRRGFCVRVEMGVRLVSVQAAAEGSAETQEYLLFDRRRHGHQIIL